MLQRVNLVLDKVKTVRERERIKARPKPEHIAGGPSGSQGGPSKL